MAYTELQMAASYGDVNRVTSLLERGLDCNAIGYAGKWSPLHVAAGRGHDATVKALLAGKADFRATDQDGRTPRDWAQWSGFHAIAAQLLSLEDNLRPKSWKDEDGRLQISLQENRGLQTNISELHDETVALRRITSGLELDLYSSQMTVASLEHELNATREKQSVEVEELRLSLSRSRSQIDCERTGNMNPRLALEFEDLQACLSESNFQMVRLESELHDARKEFDSDAVREAMTAEMARNVSETVSLRDNLTGAQSKLACLESELIDARQHLAENRVGANASFEMQENDVSSGRKELSVADVELQKLQAELQLEAKVVSSLRRECSDAKDMSMKWEETAKLEAERARTAEELFRAESSKVVAISRAFGR